jgi:hypothetical protein
MEVSEVVFMHSTASSGGNVLEPVAEQKDNPSQSTNVPDVKEVVRSFLQPTIIYNFPNVHMSMPQSNQDHEKGVAL